MKKDLKKVPIKALNFAESANLSFSEGEGDEKEKTLSMVGYSGGIIKDHWWWGNLVIDLEGMSFPKKTFPILYDHDTSKRISFTKKPNLEGYKLSIEGAVLLKNETVDKFLVDAEQGFPFQASIYAQPSAIEYVSDGETVDVNGFKFEGPGTVWRKSTFKEVSVCVFGYDSETSSVVMSEGAELDLSSCMMSNDKTTVEGDMDWNKFKEEHPEEYAAFVGNITQDVTAKFTADMKAKDDAIASLTAEKEKLSQEKEALANSENTLSSRVTEMEKKFAIQNERSIATTATLIFTAAFSASDLPTRVEDKIRQLVDYNKFVKNDVLDEKAFSEAVEKEVKDFSEGMFKEAPIMGNTGQGKDIGNPNTFSDEDAVNMAKSMLSLAGVNVDKK